MTSVIKNIIQKIKIKKKNLEKSYKIKTITINTLQECLIAFEKDQENILKESETKIETLAEEKQQLNVKAYCRRKVAAVGKLAIKNLKNKVRAIQKENTTSKSKVTDSGNTISTLESTY